MSKKIWGLIVVFVGIIAVLSLILFKTVSNNNELKETINKIEEVEKQNSKDVSKNDVSSELANLTIYDYTKEKFKVDGEEVEIRYFSAYKENAANTNSYVEVENNIYKIEGKLNKVFVLGNYIGIFTKRSHDVRGTYLTFIDFEGNLIKEFEKYNEGKLEYYITSFDANDISIEKDSITFKMQSTIHGPSLVSGDAECSKLFASGLPYTDEVKNKCGITDNTNISIKVKIIYKDNKLSDITFVEGIETYKDLNSKINN